MQLLWNMLLLCSLAILSHNVAFARPAARKDAAEGKCRDNGRSEATNDGDLSPEETSSTYEYEEPVQTWPEASPLDSGKFRIEIDLKIIVSLEEIPAGVQVNVIRKNVKEPKMQLLWNKLLLCSLVILSYNVAFARSAVRMYSTEEMFWDNSRSEDIDYRDVSSEETPSTYYEYKNPIQTQLEASPLDPGNFQIEIDFEIIVDLEETPAGLQVNVIRKNVEGLNNKDGSLAAKPDTLTGVAAGGNEASRSPLDPGNFKIEIDFEIIVIFDETPAGLQVNVIRKNVEGLRSPLDPGNFKIEIDFEIIVNFDETPAGLQVNVIRKNVEGLSNKDGSLAAKPDTLYGVAAGGNEASRSPLDPGKFQIEIDFEIIVNFDETPAGLQVNVIRKNVEGLSNKDGSLAANPDTLTGVAAGDNEASRRPLRQGKFRIATDFEITVTFDNPIGIQVDVVRKNVEGLISPRRRGKFRIATDILITVTIDIPIDLQVEIVRKNVEGLMS